MTDTISPLTADEQTVLMLAAQGEFLIESGRWEQPVLDLVKRGCLTGDKFNHAITEAGRAALASYEEIERRDVAEAVGGIEALIENQTDDP